MNQLRLLAVAALFAVPAATLSAQASKSSFEKGSRVLSVGFQTGGDYDGSGIGAQLEFGAVDFTPQLHLGIGGYIGVQRQSDGFATYKLTTTFIPVMAVGNMHFPIASQPKLDVYAGASVGFIRGSVSADTPGYNGSTSNTDSAVGIQGGARYEFGPKLAVHGQLGIGDLPLLTAGVSFRLK
jgi:hypothetical protein